MTDRQLKWDRRFLLLAQHIAQWSLDPSTKVGAVLVDPSTYYVTGLGYNGFPRGVEDTPERLNDRSIKYELVVHAEVNAILMAGNSAQGGHLYVWPSFLIPPICTRCCGIAIQKGVTRIVWYRADESHPRVQRWKDNILLARQMCVEAGVEYCEIEEGN